MELRSRVFLLSSLLSLTAGTGLFMVTAGSASQARPGSDSANETDAVTSDKPLAAFRNELLELAFKTASALPVQPHIKNRSRAQDAVVAACFELEQPLRALGYIEKIDNWLRGSGYADFAFYCARHGDTRQVQHYLDLARQVSESAQDWRRDRIKAKIATTHLWLHQSRQAAEFATGIADSESGRVDAVKAMLMSAEAFDEQIEALEGVVATGNFDQVRNALQTCAQLFDRFYDDADRRTKAEERIRNSWKKLPIMIRIELLIELAGSALAHFDQEKARELVDEARVTLESFKWNPEDQIPLMARLAEIRHQAGEEEAARKEADAALALFEAERARIVDIYRAGALRPIAETYQAMGDSVAALAVYKRAIEAGCENFNSRPRAEDLSATCRSMALHGVEPDAELRARMLQIGDGLGHPW